jgi:UDP-N-acetylglucosamine 2-epimerase (non-hydrolysing)
MNISIVAGARPNFVKIAPLVWAIHNKNKAENVQKINCTIVHTGQHYDYEMSKAFYDDLEIPEPDYFLNAGSGTHAVQTAKVMIEFEKICLKEKPEVVVVVGDVNSTLACAVTAKKLNIKVAHVEAGLRSGDMTMPEEINRIVTDSISDYLFVTEKSGRDNLLNEGKHKKQIHFVGNIMIDTLFFSLKKLKKQAQTKVEGKGISPSTSSGLIAKSQSYAVVTLHRPSNVDDKAKMKDILNALKEISKDMPCYFPMHPRTNKTIKQFSLSHVLNSSNITIMKPLPYLEFLNLWRNASLVLTDSGGIQEETTALGIPCFTIRENTERPITIFEGSNTLVGTTGKGILKAYKIFKKDERLRSLKDDEELAVRCKGKSPSTGTSSKPQSYSSGLKRKRPKLWDGKTAERILNILIKKTGT